MIFTAGRCAILAVLVAACTGAAHAQPVVRDPSVGASEQCIEITAALNRELASRRVEAFLAAANLYETGQCVERNDARALEFLAQAARGGSPQGVRRLARRFAWGQGVPQSYSNAGAWLAGKGASNEPLQPWDYSIGYAFAVLSEVLATVQYPTAALRATKEAAFVLEVDAVRPRQINLKPTAEDAAANAGLYAALATALNARVPEVVKALPSPDPALLVSARVAMPVALRLRGEGALDVLEDEPILR